MSCLSELSCGIEMCERVDHFFAVGEKLALAANADSSSPSCFWNCAVCSEDNSADSNSALNCAASLVSALLVHSMCHRKGPVLLSETAGKDTVRVSGGSAITNCSSTVRG